jgi:hypothetical protein
MHPASPWAAAAAAGAWCTHALCEPAAAYGPPDPPLPTCLPLCALQLFLHDLARAPSAAACQPPGVLRTLKSKACRGALMFGCPLGRQQCEQLVQQLRRTQLCFCCAHGRPTTAPVADVAAVLQAAAAGGVQFTAAAAAAGLSTEYRPQQAGPGRLSVQRLQQLVAHRRKRSRSTARNEAAGAATHGTG